MQRLLADSARISMLLAAALTGARTAQAEPLFTGQGVSEAARGSIDVVDAHLVFLQQQDILDTSLAYFNTTVRWAPGRMVLADGQTVPANLSRTLIDLGIGGGKPSKFAAFGGANYDIVMLSGPAASPVPGVGAPGTGQLLGFLGIAVSDVQLTVATKRSTVGEGDFARDAWGNFQPIYDAAQPGGTPLRPGAPASLASPEDAGGVFDVLTVYDGHTGAFLAATWAWDGDSRRLSEIRAHLQPLRLLARDFIESFGLPAAGFTRLDPLRDYYQESGIYREVPPPDTTPVEPEEPPPTEYEVDLGADDVLGGGLRWRVRGQVAPSVRFRRAELGLVEDFALGPLPARVGARAHVFDRGRTLTGAADAYALVSGPELGLGIGGRLPVSVATSYSYNSPESGTFLPIPEAHVFGVQFIIGDPEASKPLIPLVRVVEHKHGALGQRGGEP